jgi:hypothetical protein
MSIDPISRPENKFPLGQRIALPGHFLEPVTLEAIRFIGSGYECRVRLSDGTPDEAILSLDEAATLAGQVITAQGSDPPRRCRKTTPASGIRAHPTGLCTRPSVRR